LKKAQPTLTPGARREDNVSAILSGHIGLGQSAKLKPPTALFVAAGKYIEELLGNNRHLRHENDRIKVDLQKTEAGK